MKIILTRMPALEAALVRFDLWWNGLSRRERILVGTMAGLLAAVILIFGVIKPLQSARAEALSQIRTYETLTARIRAAGTLTTPVPRRQGAPAQILNTAAGTFGITVTPEVVPGGIRATIADGTYDSLMALLADLAATSDLRIRSATIQRKDAPGRVSAVIEFAQ